MKVLHVISSSGMYGAEAVILNLMRAFSVGPHTCALGIFDNAANQNRQLYDAAINQGFEAFLIPCSGQVDRTTILAIRALAASTAADIVHSHGYKADIYCFFAFRRSKTPLVSTCHNWCDTDRAVTLYGKLDRLVLRAFTSVVAVSTEVRQRLLSSGVQPSRLHIVRNGIDLRPFAAARPSLREDLSSDTRLIGIVGRLSPEKGIDNYLAAAAKVREQLPAARFVVVGDGPDRQVLESTIDTLKLRSSVTLLGRRDDMPSVYASLDLMVSASRREGLPIALLEGMASGLPIVATDVGEVPTIVRDGCTGLIVPPEDTSGLAQAILALLSDRERCTRFSIAARELVAAEYSAKRMAEDYLNVYDKAFAARPRKSSFIAIPLTARSLNHQRQQNEGCGRSGTLTAFCTSSVLEKRNQPLHGLKPHHTRPRVFMMDLWATLPYYTAYLSRALLDQGCQLTVGSITYYLDPTCYSSRGIRLRPGLVDIVGRFRLPRLLRRILKLQESILNLFALTIRFLFRPPDVVHVQFLPLLTSRFPLDLWFIRFCKIRGCRIVLTVHDLLPHDTGLSHKDTFLRLYAGIHALICHSADVRDRLVTEFDVPLSKLSIIPHGPFFYDQLLTDEEQTLGAMDLPKDQPLVLWQGIIFPYKGIDLLLNAWQQVESCTTEGCLVIAGTGQPALLEQIRAQVTRLNLQRVHLDFRFLSPTELVALYRAAAMVVYPYRAITTSGALATGLALGKTIIATDLRVFRELLTDRQNALLAPPPSSEAGNSSPNLKDLTCTEGLAAAIVELLGNSALRDQFATRIRDLNFGDDSWLSIARQTQTTYDSVLGVT